MHVMDQAMSTNERGSQTAALSARERELLDAAEDVVTRWAIVRVSGGQVGACGMPDALRRLDLATDAYSVEEME
jgi:hypothetical protein